MVKKILAAILFLAGLSARAQELSGDWYGWANVNDIRDADNYMVHMSLDHRGEAVTGTMSLYYMDVYRSFPVAGVYDRRSGNFMVSDLEIPRHFANLPGLTKLEMDVYLVSNLVRYRGGAQLRGRIVNKTHGLARDINFVMTRPSVSEEGQGADTASRAAADRPPAPARRTLFTHEIEVGQDSVEMALYDGAVVDDDTVSVLYNGRVVIDSVRLDASGARRTLRLDPGSPSHELVLRAENLGSIPPNTGVLIINAGARRYELFFSNSMSVSTGIKFVRTPGKGP